jgi:undecaprenyl-diphosphatase
MLATSLVGADSAQWSAFNVIIQLGAILAIVVLYWRTFWAVLVGLIEREAVSWRFVANVLAAFVPAAVIGFLLIDQIEKLLGDPLVVPITMILGAIAILVIERAVERTSIVGVAEIPLGRSIGIGFVQCLSMIPGVSRSAASIMGALSFGVERRTAAEFSFFLAVPTMLGATSLELVKHRHEILAGASGVGFATVAVGFGVSFIVAIVVVKAFVHYIARHNFVPFAWYRLMVGVIALVWLLPRQ